MNVKNRSLPLVAPAFLYLNPLKGHFFITILSFSGNLREKIYNLFDKNYGIFDIFNRKYAFHYLLSNISRADTCVNKS